jgi:hypothetical protein
MQRKPEEHSSGYSFVLSKSTFLTADTAEHNTGSEIAANDYAATAGPDR